MTLDVGLRAHLMADTAISTWVSTRIYPIRLPQKVALPAISFQQISDTRQPHLRGVAGIARARYQIDAYTVTPKDAKTLGGLIRQALDGFQGIWAEPGSPASSPDESIRIQGAFFESSMDLFDEDILGGSSRNSADYLITHVTLGGQV